MSMVRSFPRAAVLAVLLASALPADDARAQGTQIFRLEVEPEPVPRAGWAVAGYVYNDSRYRVGGVRLRAEVLDESGAQIAEAFGWVYGNVPAGGRAYFT